MKKVISILACALILALTVTAFADTHVLPGTIVMYVARDEIKAYEEPDETSPVVTKLKGGKKLLLEMVTDDGSWYSTLIEDKNHGGQMMVWVMGAELSEEILPEFCSHDWSDWELIEAATCTRTGSRVRFCAICGKRSDEEIPKLDHTYGNWVITKVATCTQKGQRSRVCQTCGYEQTQDYIDEHTYGAWTMTKEPTCKATGTRVRSCKICGYQDVQALDELPHDYSWQVTVPATDHSSGVRSRICVNCGYNGGEETYDPEGTLRRKDRSEAVYNMQQLLVEQGYLNVGGADGIFGGGTEKAVMQFQKDQGLNVDGVAWPETLKRMQHDFGPWITVKEMTRTEPGERVRVCVDCNYEQHEIIESGTVFEFGRRGEDIRALQQIIKEVGYDAGSFDGIYGKKLDSAFAAFAADNGLIVYDGKVRPADVDALINVWFDKTDDSLWMGEGNNDTPVNLALSVTPTVGTETVNGITTYSWTLTNLGSEKAIFNTLLLTFGENADFRSNDLVMVIDGFELKPGAGNSVSGSFTADCDWGEGSLNFAAMAISQETGARWLSNNVSFANQNTPAPKTVLPMIPETDLAHLADGIYPVSFDRGDVFSGTSGIFMNAVHIYAEEIYDIVDMHTLNPGDTIMVEEADGFITVNGADEMNALLFVPVEDSNVYRIYQDDDLATYTELGVTTLSVSAEAVFTDSWDIESEPVTYSSADMVAAMQSSENDYFVEFNTTVRIENGQVVEVTRVYVP